MWGEQRWTFQADVTISGESLQLKEAFSKAWVQVGDRR